MRLLELFEEINSLGGKMYSDPDGGSYQSIGFWHNPKTNQYVEVNWGWDRGEDAIDKHHSDAVMQNPEQFGLPSEFDFTDFGTDEAVEAVVPNGWNRVGVFHQMASIDAASLKLAARTTTWLLRNGYNIASLMIDIVQETTGTTHINGTENVEMFARTGRVPRARMQEAIRVQEPQGGLLYRWVEPRKALSNLKTNSLNPGKWKHDIPGVGHLAGISFGYSQGAWRIDDADVCFVVDRGKMNPKKFVDIPAQEVYNYSTARHHPVGDAAYADEYKKGILDPDVEPTEAFYVGIVRPLNKVLVEIIIQQSIKKKPKLYDAVREYALIHKIPIKWAYGSELGSHELGLISGELKRKGLIEDHRGVDLSFYNGTTDSYSGQSNGTLWAYDKSKYPGGFDLRQVKGPGIYGYVDWVLYQGELQIQMIEVHEDFRRQGIATKMHNWLQHWADQEGYELIWSNMTPDGAALKKSLDEDIYRSNSPCVPLAILRVTDTDPDEVQNACVASNWSERAGMNTGQMVRAVKALGFDYKSRFDLMFGERELPDGRKIRRPRTLAQLMKVIPDQGRFLINVKKHTVAIVDGKLLDDAMYGLRHRVEDVMEVFPSRQEVSEERDIQSVLATNPSVRDVTKMMREAEVTTRYPDLRGAVAKDGTVYVWPAALGTHTSLYQNRGGPIHQDDIVDVLYITPLGAPAQADPVWDRDETVSSYKARGFTVRAFVDEAKHSNVFRSWIGNKMTEDWDDEGEEWEPETITIRRGTNLYHGSNAEWNGSNPNPPFWVSDSRDVAEWFATWKDDDGEPTLYTYQADHDLTLVAMHDRSDMEEVAERLHLDGADDPTEFAEEICRHLGLDGWIIPNNYQTGADIMLCNPRQQLRMVDTDLLEEVITEARAMPYKSWINARTQQIIKVDDHTNHSWTVYEYPERFGLSQNLVRQISQIDDYDDLLHNDDLYDAIFTEVKANHWVRCEIDQFSALFDGKLRDCQRVMRFAWEQVPFQQADVESERGYLILDSAEEIETFIKTGRGGMREDDRSGMVKLYHLTDNPNFELDPNYAPEDNTVSIQDRSGIKGVYLARDVEQWVNGHDYWRPFVVEMYADPELSQKDRVGRWGGEVFVPAEDFDKLQINRVIPLDAYAREQFGQHGWIEGRLGVEFDTGERITVKPYEHPFSGYTYQGDARRLPRADINRIRQQFAQAGLS